MTLHITTTTAAGPPTPTSITPGQTIQETLTPVWTAHKNRHRNHCGAVTGPLRNLICRQGHTL